MTAVVMPPVYGRGMAKAIDPATLVGAAEIGERLGMDRKSVHQLHHRHPDFPEPVAVLKQAMIWSWPAVEAWARATGRLTT